MREWPLPSGIKYWDIFIGEGNPAEKGHAVRIIYTAWTENGKEFASSVVDGKPVIFTLGAGQVVSRDGSKGIVGMKAGGKRQIHIPPALAYGAAGCRRQSRRIRHSSSMSSCLKCNKTLRHFRTNRRLLHLSRCTFQSVSPNRNPQLQPGATG